MSERVLAFTKWFPVVCLAVVLGVGLAAEEAPVTPPVEPAAAEEGAGEKAAEDDEATREAEEEAVAVARPVPADPVQVYGWKEWVVLSDGKNELKVAAKLDTGAFTSSVHATEKKLFERDGSKWVRFVVTDPRSPELGRIRIEAPLVRTARIKEPGGESESREVVRLPFRIGDRSMKVDFTLSDRSNMLNPVLIGRTTLQELGWVDPARAFIADDKVMR